MGARRERRTKLGRVVGPEERVAHRLARKLLDLSEGDDAPQRRVPETDLPAGVDDLLRRSELVDLRALLGQLREPRRDLLREWNIGRVE